MKIKSSSFLVVLALLASTSLPAQAAVTLIQTPTPVVTTLEQKTITLTPPISNSPGSWTVVIDNPALATANGLTLTLLTVGTSVIEYFQAASGEYTPSSRHSRLTINPGIPTLGAFADQSLNLSQSFITLAAPTSSSDGTWSFESLNSDVAVVSGNTVSLRDGGTVQIRANQATTQKWAAASKTMTLTINAPVPTIGSFSDITLSIDSVSKVQLTLPTSNSKGGWTLTSSDPSVASLEGYTLVALKTGTSIITAKQSAAGGFRSTSVQMKVSILAVAPSVTKGNFKDIAIELDPGATKVVVLQAPTSNSTGAWTYASSDAVIASINGQVLTALKPGKVTVTATQAAVGNFAATTPETITVRVQGKQSLTPPASVTKLVGDPAIKIAYPTSLSDGAWSAVSSAPTIVGVINGVLSFDSAGRATITLIQAATDSYLANTVTFDVIVIGTPPTLGAFAPQSVGVGEKLTNPVLPSSNSQGKWVFSSSDPSVASIVDNVITGIKAGTAVISAYQEPAGKYGQSPTVQANITVKPSPTIAAFANLELTMGAGTRQIAAPVSQSTGSWSYSSSNPAIATVSNGVLNPVAVGSVTITGTQAGNSTFASAVRTFTVLVKAAPESRASASLGGRVISVYVANVTGKSVIVKINGVIARVGKNTVGAGKRTVTVQVNGKLLLTKQFIVK